MSIHERLYNLANDAALGVYWMKSKIQFTLAQAVTIINHCSYLTIFDKLKLFKDAMNELPDCHIKLPDRTAELAKDISVDTSSLVSMLSMYCAITESTIADTHTSKNRQYFTTFKCAGATSDILTMLNVSTVYHTFESAIDAGIARYDLAAKLLDDHTSCDMMVEVFENNIAQHTVEFSGATATIVNIVWYGENQWMNSFFTDIEPYIPNPYTRGMILLRKLSSGALEPFVLDFIWGWRNNITTLRENRLSDGSGVYTENFKATEDMFSAHHTPLCNNMWGYIPLYSYPHAPVYPVGHVLDVSVRSTVDFEQAGRGLALVSTLLSNTNRLPLDEIYKIAKDMARDAMYQAIDEL